jgi:hypothetical protein
MRTLIVSGILIVLAIRLLAWAWSAPVEAQGPSAEPLVTVVPTATTTPAPAPTATLAQLGTPSRVQFKPGAYGESLQVEGQKTFVLWARAGQVMKLTSDRTFAARLSAPSGNDVPFTELTATLPANGDYLLTVAGEGGFTFWVDIR